MKKGSGTSISGYFVEKYASSLVSYFQGKYQKVIFISGTNGKTTTRGMINAILQKNGIQVISNYGGANIYRGILSSLLKDLTWRGQVISKYAVLEVEEATLPKLTKYFQPDILILTNLARDQLDAYGELDTTQAYFQTAINQSGAVQLIINADDPKLLELEYSNTYGSQLEHQTLQYETGGNPRIQLKELFIFKNSTDSIVFKDGMQMVQFPPKLVGDFNAVNYGLAVTVSVLLKIPEKVIASALSDFSPVFARQEKIVTEYTEHMLILVKNPLGLESVLQSDFMAKYPTILFGLNDRIADGKDVSWLWDVDFESFVKSHAVNWITTGERASDITLRISQALRMNGKQDQAVRTVTLDESMQELLTSPVPVCILATYTASRDIRDALAKIISLPAIDSDIY